MPDYTAFGLRVRAAVSLPGLVEVPVPDPPDAPPDVELLFDAPPWGAVPRVRQYASPAEDGQEPTVVVWSLPTTNAIVLSYAEGMRFHITTDGARVWAEWDSPLTIADAMTFIVGPVLGYALRRRGSLVLHASSVRIDGVAVAFIGAGGAGKSTLAVACVQSGLPLVTDDILVLRESDGNWWTTPAPDQVRLWDDSARLLFGDDSALPVLTPNWPKRGLAIEAAGLGMVREPVPLGVLFLLNPSADGASAPRIELLSGGEALVGLVTNSYANYLLDAGERATELRAIGRVASRVTVRRLVTHTDATRLRETIALVADEVRAR